MQAHFAGQQIQSLWASGSSGPFVALLGGAFLELDPKDLRVLQRIQGDQPLVSMAAGKKFAVLLGEDGAVYTLKTGR